MRDREAFGPPKNTSISAELLESVPQTKAWNVIGFFLLPVCVPMVDTIIADSTASKVYSQITILIGCAQDIVTHISIQCLWDDVIKTLANICRKSSCSSKFEPFAVQIGSIYELGQHT